MSRGRAGAADDSRDVRPLVPRLPDAAPDGRARTHSRPGGASPPGTPGPGPEPHPPIRSPTAGSAPALHSRADETGLTSRVVSAGPFLRALVPYEAEPARPRLPGPRSRGSVHAAAVPCLPPVDSWLFPPRRPPEGPGLTFSTLARSFGQQTGVALSLCLSAAAGSCFPGRWVHRVCAKLRSWECGRDQL